MDDLMLWIVGAGAVLVVLLGILSVLRRSNRAPGAPWPVYAKRVLGEREQVLYWRLAGAFPKHVVLAQVSLAQLLGVQKGTTIDRPFSIASGTLVNADAECSDAASSAEHECARIEDWGGCRNSAVAAG